MTLKEYLEKNKYITGLVALALNGADWHKASLKLEKINYPKELRDILGDYGIVKQGKNEIATNVRAFLDLLIYEIRYKKRVPNYTFRDFLFFKEEKNELKEKLKDLKKIFNKEEIKLYTIWQKYNEGKIKYVDIIFKGDKGKKNNALKILKDLENYWRERNESKRGLSKKAYRKNEKSLKAFI